MTLRRRLGRVFVPRAVATLAALVGLALPWTKVNPSAETVPSILLPGTESGFAAVGPIVLPILVALCVAPGLVVLAGRRIAGLLAAITALCGALLLFVPATHVWALSAEWESTFVPDVGTYLTAGVGLAVCLWAVVEWRYLDDAAAAGRELAETDREG